MTTFNLVNIEKIGEKIDKYIYRNNENSNSIHFHSHPTRAFCMVIDFASDDLDKKIIKKLLNKFMNNAIDQHNYKGGFKEAISVLSF